MTITRNTARRIRDQLEAALGEVAANFGLTSSLGTMAFSGNNVRCKIELAAISDDGVIQGEAADRFLRECWIYGLNPEELGQWFASSGGRKLQIIGLNPRAKRYPITCKDQHGNCYKFAATTVRHYLDQQKAIS